MNKCKTCRFWHPVKKLSNEAKQYNQGGDCHNPNILEGDFVTDEGYAVNRLVYPYPEGAGYLWTGPEFGCIHHEAKDQENTELTRPNYYLDH